MLTYRKTGDIQSRGLNAVFLNLLNKKKKKEYKALGPTLVLSVVFRYFC